MKTPLNIHEHRAGQFQFLCCVMLHLVFSAHGATVLWNEATDGTLDSNPYAPTNYTYVVHPIGTATDCVNYVFGHVTVTPYPGYPTIFEATVDSFSFTIPTNRQFSGLLLNYSVDLPSQTFGGLYASTTGPYDGAGNLGTWVARQVSTTNDLFANLGLSALPSGNYSFDVGPLLQDYNWPTNGTISYSLSIITSPMPPTLWIVKPADQMVLSWNTNNAVGFFLQSATNLNVSGGWTTMTNIPAMVGNQMVVTNSAEGRIQFFRLARPKF